MAETVETAIYRMGVEGEEQLAAAASAVDQLAIAEERVTVATRTSQDAMDRLLGRLDPRIRAEQQLQRALEQVARFEREGIGSEAGRAQAIAAATARYDEALGRLKVRSVSIADTSGLAAHQVQNLTFQVNDLVTSIASGQDPFRVMLQQGAQMAQVFAPGTGVGAAMKGLGGAIVAFVTNPLNLAVLGLSAAAGAASLLFDSLDEADAANEVLDRHKDIVQRVAAAYREATGAAADFGQKIAAVTRLEAEKNLQEQLAALEAAKRDLSKSRELTRGLSLLGVSEQDIRALDTLNAAVSTGKISVDAYREALDRASISLSSEAARDYAFRLLTASDGAMKLELQANEARAAIDALNATMAGGTATAAERRAGFLALQQGLAGQTVPASDALGDRFADAFGTGGARSTPAASVAAPLDMIPSSAATATDAIQALDDKLSDARDTMKDFASTFLDGILAGKSAAESAADAIDNLARKLLDKGVNMLVDGIFAGIGGLIGSSGSGGLPGGAHQLLEFHDGGTVGETRRPRSRPGLAGDEVLAVLQKGEEVIPRSRGAAPAINVVQDVKVINNAGVKVATRQGERGGIEIVLEAVEAKLPDMIRRGRANRRM